ncbi:MAG: hypothetical protein CSA39_04950 [Flavobacteriales bacterium]|nr:MAG: hypothetical protein CSA39_04950 [Flavobacteriales bacterium]
MSNFNKNLNEVDVTQLIPQRTPIVMVDALFNYTDKEVTSGLTVKNGNIFLKNNTFREPGLIEHMAQSVALHTGYQYFLKNKPAPTGYIGAIKSVKITTLPQVNDKLVTTVSILHEIMGVTLVKINTAVNNTIIATAEMKTVVV